MEAGAKEVVISAPTKDETVKTIVMGVNEDELKKEVCPGYHPAPWRSRLTF